MTEPSPKDAAPAGAGYSGWIGPRQSEVQLPASCARPMGASAPNVTLTLKVAPGVTEAATQSPGTPPSR